MAKVTIDISHSNGVTAFSNQKKLVKTSDGILFLFAAISTFVPQEWVDPPGEWTPSGLTTIYAYKKSTDNGVNWDSWTEISITPSDVYIDINDDILVTSGNYFVKLIRSSGNIWIEETPVEITSGSINIPIMTRRSNGDIYVAGGDFTAKIVCFKSSDEGVTWSDVSYTSYHHIPYGMSILPVGTDIWILTAKDNTVSGELVVAKYNGTSWSYEVIATLGSNWATLSAGKVSDDEIYCVTQSVGKVTVFTYTGTWDSGVALSLNPQFPAISIIGGLPVVVWKDEGGATGFITYRIWNGLTWDSQVDVTDNTVYNYPTVCQLDNNYLYLSFEDSSYLLSDEYSPPQYVVTPNTIYFDKKYLVHSKKKIYSNSHVRVLSAQHDILSNTNVIGSYRKLITADSHTKIVDAQETILSDSEAIPVGQKRIISNSYTKVVGGQQTILSNSAVRKEILSNIVNKVGFVIGVLHNINEDIRFSFRKLYNIGNSFNMCVSKILNINNDLRTQKRIFNNILNDIRFINTAIRPIISLGFQSLGKEYIRIYINSIEQTDADVDSVIIKKSVNAAQSASFNLGRAYDSSKPNLESTVMIKYHDWVLFNGYITTISPSDSPESIRIECLDKYWLDNRTNKYFKVGHTPEDDKELYYETIYSAISSEYSWNLSLGNFVPETINCFGQPQSDALTTLLTEAGNYGWFFDETQIRRLWVAGEGNIISLQRQSLNKNLDLYQVLEHRFSEDAKDIVNQLRVQMGAKTIAKDPQSQASEWKSAGYYTYYLQPAWDSQYEILAKNSPSGKGYDNHPTEEDYLYKDVFKVYNLFRWPNTEWDASVGLLSGDYPPVLSIASGGYWGGILSPSYSGFELFNITKGFTVDYEKGTVTFDEPHYFYTETSLNERTTYRMVPVSGRFWIKNSWKSTTTPTSDPTTEIANPLMFFTSKVGSYPSTILGELELPSLTVQVGGTWGTTIVPSWDDTAFAQDYAYWQLSKTSEKHISGTILVTLDAICFYNIDLAKRIFINGITETNMNILSLSYNLSQFTVEIEVENSTGYMRTVSLPSRGE